MSDTRTHDPQPLPMPGDGRKVFDVLHEAVEARRQLGVRKYGTELEPRNSREALRDLIDEQIDGAAYALQVLMERETAGEGEAVLVEEFRNASMKVYIRDISPPKHKGMSFVKLEFGFRTEAEEFIRAWDAWMNYVQEKRSNQ